MNTKEDLIREIEGDVFKLNLKPLDVLSYTISQEDRYLSTFSDNLSASNVFKEMELSSKILSEALSKTITSWHFTQDTSYFSHFVETFNPLHESMKALQGLVPLQKNVLFQDFLVDQANRDAAVTKKEGLSLRDEGIESILLEKNITQEMSSALNPVGESALATHNTSVNAGYSIVIQKITLFDFSLNLSINESGPFGSMNLRDISNWLCLSIIFWISRKLSNWF